MPRVELRNYKAASSPMETLFRLFRYFRHCAPILAAAVVSIAIYAAATIGSSYCMKPLVNLLKESGIAPNEVYAKYMALLAGLAALYLLSAVTNYLLNRLMLECSTVIMRELRSELFTKMQRLPIRYFDNNTHGSLMSYFTNDIEATNEHLQQAARLCFSSIFYLPREIVFISVQNIKNLFFFWLTILLKTGIILSVGLLPTKEDTCNAPP